MNLSVSEERQELERVIHSPQFRRAPQLQRFLVFICESHFQGAAEQLSEFQVATEAFGRSGDFDPAQDSIVRVQAREARRRLREVTGPCCYSASTPAARRRPPRRSPMSAV
ncbi:MAG: hypothetical protein FJW20_04155 [Acidimicrobiia bacterium]|nr:hypothetical protein [Acidimicrobiia bacterium]